MTGSIMSSIFFRLDGSYRCSANKLFPENFYLRVHIAEGFTAFETSFVSIFHEICSYPFILDIRNIIFFKASNRD